MNEFLKARLDKITNENRLRKLQQGGAGIDLTSNDYLGLAQSKELFDKVQQRIASLGVQQNGATGSRLLSGNSEYTQHVEKKIAHIFKSEAALIFNSGYSANLAVLSSLPQRGDTILYDELAHASIKDGVRLSLANRFSFKHNDVQDLETKLKKTPGKKFVVVESIYSMNGDQCALADFVSLTKKYGAHIILDEAHSTGVIGNEGAGLAVSLALQNQIDVRIYTFGKAMGSHGACITGSDMLIQYLINVARPLIYTTALPPHSIASIDCSFDFLKDQGTLQNVLQKKINLFLHGTQNIPNVSSNSNAIQTALFSGNENVRSAASYLQAKNFDIRPILSPTVPVGSERLRICLHTFNEDKDIIELAMHLRELSQSLKII